MIPSQAAWRSALQNALAAFRHRYAGSGIGVFWNVIHPLIQLIVFVSVAWIVRGTERGDGSSALFVCCALVPWLSFSEALLQSSQAIVRNAGFMRSMDVSGAAFVAESTLASLLGMFVTLGLLVVAVVGIRGELRIEFLLAGLVAVLLHAFAFGLALALSGLNALLPDIAEVLRSGLHLWMWTMPIVYPENRIPEGWSWTLNLNLPWIFVRSIRDLLIGGAPVSFATWAGMVGTSLAAIWLGMAVLRRLEPAARDVL